MENGFKADDAAILEAGGYAVVGEADRQVLVGITRDDKGAPTGVALAVRRGTTLAEVHLSEIAAGEVVELLRAARRMCPVEEETE